VKDFNRLYIKVFHTMSALKSTILVHVNNLPYTQDGVVIYLTIDMFQFTDVTASYVYERKAVQQ